MSSTVNSAVNSAPNPTSGISRPTLVYSVETGFWGVVCSALILFSLYSLAEFANPQFHRLLVIRLALMAAASLALMWRATGQRLPSGSAAGVLILILTERFTEMVILRVEAPSMLQVQLAVALFVGAAIVFRGSNRLWWGALVPWAFLSQTLIALEFAHRPDVRMVASVRAGMWVILGLLAVAVIFALRSNRNTSSNLEPVTSSSFEEPQMKSVFSVLRLRRELQLELDLPRTSELNETSLEMEAISYTEIAPASYSGDKLSVALHYPLPAGIPADQLREPAQIFSVLKEVVSEQGERIQRAWELASPRERSFRSQTRLALNAPNETVWPIVVRGDLLQLRKVFQSLLLGAIDSANSSGQGIVRVNFRVGLSSLSIAFEDNGRGFNEQMLGKIASRTRDSQNSFMADSSSTEMISISEIRQALEDQGNDLEFLARLGVGTRVTLDFPRLDAYSRQSMRPNEAISSATSKDLAAEIEARRS